MPLLQAELKTYPPPLRKVVDGIFVYTKFVYENGYIPYTKCDFEMKFVYEIRLGANLASGDEIRLQIRTTRRKFRIRNPDFVYEIDGFRIRIAPRRRFRMTNENIV